MSFIVNDLPFPETCSQCKLKQAKDDDYYYCPVAKSYFSEKFAKSKRVKSCKLSEIEEYKE